MPSPTIYGYSAITIEESEFIDVHAHHEHHLQHGSSDVISCISAVLYSQLVNRFPLFLCLKMLNHKHVVNGNLFFFRHRKLYWFEIENKNFNPVRSFLFKSNLDGSLQHVLANISDVPNGLTIDIFDGRIYWVAKNSRSIESVNQNGEDKYVIAKSLGTPIGLTIYMDHLYFCEQEKEHAVASSVSSVRKHNGTNYDQVVIKNVAGNAWCQDISAYHSSLQPGITRQHKSRCLSNKMLYHLLVKII